MNIIVQGDGHKRITTERLSESLVMGDVFRITSAEKNKAGNVIDRYFLYAYGGFVDLERPSSAYGEIRHIKTIELYDAEIILTRKG